MWVAMEVAMRDVIGERQRRPGSAPRAARPTGPALIITAALKHLFVERNGLFQRMWPWRSNARTLSETKT